MKKLLTTVALLASLFATPAPAAEVDGVDARAYWFTVMLIYDSGCAKLPDLLMYGVALELKDMPDSVVNPATTKVHDQLVTLGKTEFCARAKPRMDKAASTKESQ